MNSESLSENGEKVVRNAYAAYDWKDGYHRIDNLENEEVRIIKSFNGKAAHQVSSKRGYFSKPRMDLVRHGNTKGKYEIRPAIKEEIEWLDRAIAANSYVPQYIDKNGNEIVVGDVYENIEYKVLVSEITSIYSKGILLNKGHEFLCKDGIRNSSIQPAEDQEYWKKCFAARKVIQKKELSESEQLVKSGQVELGKIYVAECTDYSIPMTTGPANLFGGPFIRRDYYSNWVYTDRSFRIDPDNVEELTESDPNYNWVKYMFDNKKWLSKQDYKKLQYQYADVKYNFDKINPQLFELTFKEAIDDHTVIMEAFNWEATPQKDEYWNKIHNHGHTDESLYYLTQMKEQYKEYLAENEVTNDSPPTMTKEITPTREYGGVEMTIDELVVALSEVQMRFDGASLDKSMLKKTISVLEREIKKLRLEIFDHQVTISREQSFNESYSHRIEQLLNQISAKNTEIEDLNNQIHAKNRELDNYVAGVVLESVPKTNKFLKWLMG